MRDIYLYEDGDVLGNLLNINDKKLLEDAEADSMAKLWRIHPFREGNTRTIVTFAVNMLMRSV